MNGTRHSRTNIPTNPSKLEKIIQDVKKKLKGNESPWSVSGSRTHNLFIFGFRLISHQYLCGASYSFLFCFLPFPMLDLPESIKSPKIHFSMINWMHCLKKSQNYLRYFLPFFFFFCFHLPSFDIAVIHMRMSQTGFAFLRILMSQVIN